LQDESRRLRQNAMELSQTCVHIECMHLTLEMTRFSHGNVHHGIL